MLKALDAETERSACPLCGAYAPRRSPYGSGVFRVVRCGECRLWYLSPRLTEDRIATYYRRGDYFEGGASGYDSYATQEKSLRATFRGLLKHLAKRGMTGGAVLDVGCGYGFFLQEAAPHFRFRAGTEMSAAAAAHARTRADAVYTGGIEAIPPGKRFDCIVALHVIEHVYRPQDFLRRLRSHLNPAGSIVLAAPDMGSIWRLLMGRRWPSFKYPEHVVFYDSKTLPALLGRAGLRDIETLPYPHAFPVAEVCGKLGLPRIPGLGACNLWLPATTVAAAGRISGRAPA